MPNGSPPAGMQAAPMDPRVACLVMRNANPVPWIGTGWWVSPHALVTAAHVLAGAAEISTSSGLIPVHRAQAPGFDCATLFFNTPVQFHFGVADPGFGVQSQEVETLGFAGFDGGQQLWLSRGVVVVDAQDAVYDAITEAGQSGGAVRLRSAPDLLVGMHRRAGGFLRLSAALLPALIEWSRWVPRVGAMSMAPDVAPAPPQPVPGLEPSKEAPPVGQPAGGGAPPTSGVAAPAPPLSPAVPLVPAVAAPTQLPGIVLDDADMFEGRVVVYRELSNAAAEIMAMVRASRTDATVVLYDADTWASYRAYKAFEAQAMVAASSRTGNAAGVRAQAAPARGASGLRAAATGVGAVADAAAKALALMRTDVAIAGRVFSTDLAYLTAELGRYAAGIKLIVPQHGVAPDPAALDKLRSAFGDLGQAHRSEAPPEHIDAAIARAGGMDRLLIGACVDSVLDGENAAILRIDVAAAGAVRRVRQHLLSRITGNVPRDYRGGVIISARLTKASGELIGSSGFRLLSAYECAERIDMSTAVVEQPTGDRILKP